MWNKEKKAEEGRIADATSFFAQGFKLIGNIDADNDIRIEGKIEGNIRTSKKVIIGSTGSISGNIHATNISLMGEVSGDIFISGLAQIGDTAKINGTITADKLQIDPGAVIEAAIKRFSPETSNNKHISKAVMKGIKTLDNKTENYQMAKAL